ncbi:hypothetical protein [Streptomyces bambusae]|uniref:hypothetical protein n=1 Tax=Streptomyces bambusae TaxID=1550616 RepID=UPI0027E0C67D|nr:hypothetical protein [Streptomyces bambusae]
MIELPAAAATAFSHWFPAGAPGIVGLAEHVRATGNGRWWADRPVDARTPAVECGDLLLLRGDPRALDPEALAPFALHRVEAPARFVPVLRAAFPCSPRGSAWSTSTMPPPCRPGRRAARPSDA